MVTATSVMVVGRLYGKIYGRLVKDDKAYRSYYYYHHEEDDEEAQNDTENKG